MRKHGWQLPYHPLQVVAVAVFLALGFAFYVFFVPFVGRKVFQYVVMGLYTPLITSAFGLYIWCAAADPADPGVFKSKKYLNTLDNGNCTLSKEAKLGGESNSSINRGNASGERTLDEGTVSVDADAPGEHPISENEKKNVSAHHSSCFKVLLGLCPCTLVCNCLIPREQSSAQMTEDGMFYCNLCKVEVFKYSKHCRVCDKCIDQFDHHCRWLNNCVGKKNYRQFFALMVSSLLLLTLQWSIGILVIICCFLERKQISVEITSKLGSSFSFTPFVIVVALCTILAMIGTLPLAQLFFFHVLLIKKGISTYDYIIAMREQEQQGVSGHQSPQMSPASSLTGLSSASSFSTFHRGAWCTPPRLFLEDQFDVVPPDACPSVSSSWKKSAREEPIRKRNPGSVKINPWTLARLNAEEVLKVTEQKRKKSKILQPVIRKEAPLGLETDSGSSSGQIAPKPENRKRVNKRVRLPADLPLEPLAKSKSNDLVTEASSSLAPLQLEARSAFRTSRAMSVTPGIIASSPDSSLDSPDLHPFPVSSSRPASIASVQKNIPLSRSTSDGYEASGGEDSDRVSSRTVHRSSNWSTLLFSSGDNEKAVKSKASSSSSRANDRTLK